MAVARADISKKVQHIIAVNKIFIFDGDNPFITNRFSTACSRLPDNYLVTAITGCMYLMASQLVGVRGPECVEGLTNGFVTSSVAENRPLHGG